MSRDLPSRPNLDHLKKQAKALLHAMRQQRGDATLTDAQHALARDYGFASWPRLKAHVESLPAQEAPQPAPVFHRFTEAARRTLFFSRYEATQLGRLVINPEHVLLGLIRGAAGTSRVVLDGAGVMLDTARAVVAAANPPRDEIVEPVQVPFQSATKALFTVAAEEADRLGHQKIATVHIVLALLCDAGAAASFLRDSGITADSVRAAAASGGAAAQDDE